MCRVDDEASADDLIDQAVRIAQQEEMRYLELGTGINEVLAKRSNLIEGNLYVRWLMPLGMGPDLV